MLPPYPNIDIETLLEMLPPNLRQALAELASAPIQQIRPPMVPGGVSPDLPSQKTHGELPLSFNLAEKHKLQDEWTGYENTKAVGRFRTKSYSPTGSLASFLREIRHPMFKGRSYTEVEMEESDQVFKELGLTRGSLPNKKLFQKYLDIVNGERVYGRSNREISRVVQNVLKALMKGRK